MKPSGDVFDRQMHVLIEDKAVRLQGRVVYDGPESEYRHGAIACETNDPVGEPYATC